MRRLVPGGRGGGKSAVAAQAIRGCVRPSRRPRLCRLSTCDVDRSGRRPAKSLTATKQSDGLPGVSVSSKDAAVVACHTYSA